MGDIEFGKKLAELRKKAAFTQKQVADYLGISNPSTVASWEGGKSEPSAANLMRICSLFEVENVLEAFGYGFVPSKQANYTIEPLSESPLLDSSKPVELKRGVFAGNVNKYMLKNNVTQKDICDMLGVNSSLVSKWLDGDELPNIKTVDALANFLHVKRNNLLDKKNTTYKNTQEKNTALSDDALEVAEAYAALTDNNVKNMIRRALALPELPDIQKKGALNANNAETTEEFHVDAGKKAI